MPAKKKSPATGRAKRTAPTAPAAAARVDLFDRVATILNQAQASAVRAVNTRMVLAYWLIGREIVEELQGGKERAAYGQQVLDDLSRRLTERFGKGFSVTNLRSFRIFYTIYAERVSQIQQTLSAEFNAHAAGREKTSPFPIQQTPSGEFDLAGVESIGQTPSGESGAAETGRSILEDLERATTPGDEPREFLPQLGWGHYQELMRVENRNERHFYEIEAAKEGWDVRHLRRQIQTFLFARLLKSRNKVGVMDLARKGMEVSRPVDVIKSPYVLDFLGLPEADTMRESDLESAIIGNLQTFLLELGKGFAFVARQKRIDFDGDFFYIDLVFYHCILKCHVLIDLKLGKLTHQDVGQMDSYVRMYDDLHMSPGDNPTIGLILCSDKGGAIARYSVLKESRQIFASRYTLHLPTEDELRREIERERRLLEERLDVQADR
jgi:predicted nuclease of restriction endonuclease-like (RecB) superfamily